MTTLNSQQQAAVQLLHRFHAGESDNQSPFALLKGYAGTGKTFSLTAFLEGLDPADHQRIAITAPTNKAVRVIRQQLGNQFPKLASVCTIFSLLGLKLEKNGEVKQLAIPSELADLSKLDFVIIDEASMINTPLWTALTRSMADFDFLTIFLGDPAQLPPVGEPRSKVWEQVPPEHTVELTEIMRFDNQILRVTGEVRASISAPGRSLTLESDFDDAGGVYKLSKPAFLEAMQQAARAGDFSTGETKAIAWRNAEVAKYNFLIRQEIFPDCPQFYTVGDRITALEPINKLLTTDTLLTTDEEAEVLEVVEVPHPIHGEFDCYHLRVRTDAGREVVIYPVAQSSARRLEAKLTELSTKAKAGQRACWGEFWKLKEDFAQIRHAYAITAHKSQGSTYQTAFVDYRDILSNRDREEALRCLYVACSRPKTRLYLA